MISPLGTCILSHHCPDESIGTDVFTEQDLIVPITLIAHYVRLYDEPYLKRQVHLHPHPLELMLRNHG